MICEKCKSIMKYKYTQKDIMKDRLIFIYECTNEHCKELIGFAW